MNLIFLCVLTYAIIYVLIHQIIFRFYLLKYSLFFSSTLVLTSSIYVGFILSTDIIYLVKICASYDSKNSNLAERSTVIWPTSVWINTLYIWIWMCYPWVIGPGPSLQQRYIFHRWQLWIKTGFSRHFLLIFTYAIPELTIDNGLCVGVIQNSCNIITFATHEKTKACITSLERID